MALSKDPEKRTIEGSTIVTLIRARIGVGNARLHRRVFARHPSAPFQIMLQKLHISRLPRRFWRYLFATLVVLLALDLIYFNGLNRVYRCSLVRTFPSTLSAHVMLDSSKIVINNRSSYCPESLTVSNPKRYFNKEVCCQHAQGKSLEKLCGVVNETTLGNKKLSGLPCTCVDFMACKTVALTAISSDHYREVQDAIASVQNFHPNMNILVYDLGLKFCELEHLRTLYNVKVVQFPFERYPPHVSSLGNYAWKILVINATLQSHDIVFWMDSSIRLKAPLTDKILSDLQVFPFRAQQVALYDGVFTYDCMYKWFGVTRAQMGKKFQIQATVQFLRNSPFLHKNIYSELVECALAKDCISPPFSTRFCLGLLVGIYPSNDILPEDVENGHCFRYDQSALTIVIYKNLNITRETTFLNYFPESLDLYRQYTECFFLFHL